MAPKHAETLSVDRTRVSSSQLAQDQTSDTVSESQSLWRRPGRIVLAT